MWAQGGCFDRRLRVRRSRRGVPVAGSQRPGMCPHLGLRFSRLGKRSRDNRCVGRCVVALRRGHAQAGLTVIDFLLHPLVVQVLGAGQRTGKHHPGLEQEHRHPALQGQAMLFHQVRRNESHKPKDQGKQQVWGFDLLHVTVRFDVRACQDAPVSQRMAQGPSRFIRKTLPRKSMSL